MAEVVGLLAATISLFEAFPLVKNVIRSRKRFDSDSQKLADAALRVILVEETALRNTLSALFRAALPPQLVTAQLLNSSINVIESNEFISFLIAEYLGDSYGSFHHSLRRFLMAAEILFSKIVKTEQGESRIARRVLRSYDSYHEISMLLSEIRDTSRMLHEIVMTTQMYENPAKVNVSPIKFPEERFEESGMKDNMSVGTAETEVFGSSASLSFLEIILTSVRDEQQGQTPTVTEDALLDTGASHSCISAELATQLEAEINATDSQTITTATFRQPMFQSGVVKLKVEWQGEEGEKTRLKIWAYVIPELSIPLILSHDFITKHPEVWKLAKKEESLLDHVNVLRFGKIKNQDKQKERDFQSQKAQENAQQEQLEDEQALRELERQLDKLRAGDAQSESSAMASTSEQTSTAAARTET